MQLRLTQAWCDYILCCNVVLNDVQVVEGSNGTVKIVSSNAGKEFAAEEISAQVLRKLVDDASKFLNDKVINNDFAHILILCRHGHFIRTSQLAPAKVWLCQWHTISVVWMLLKGRSLIAERKLSTWSGMYKNLC